MAYYEDGTYYFNPELDGEDAQALEQAERLDHAFRYRQGKNLQAQEANLSKTLMEEALKEAGLSQEEYTRLFYENHDEAKALLSDGMKHVTTNLARKKGKTQQPKATPKGEQDQPTEARENKVLQVAKEKVNRGSNLTQEEELDVIGSLIGRL